MAFDDDEFLMISGIQHYLFCRRQWALIHIEQQWKENYQTTAGNIMHDRVHQDGKFELRGDVLTVRGLRVSSNQYGVTGQCDLVEFYRDEKGISLSNHDGTWRPVPVEYKRGKPKEGLEDIAQLCLQALCLEEMLLVNIPVGYLYYGTNRRRVEVVFTRELRVKIASSINEMHELYKRGYTPRVKASGKCKSCSLSEMCIPRLQKTIPVEKYIDERLLGGGSG